MKRWAFAGAVGMLTMGAVAAPPEVTLQVGDETHGFVVRAVTDLPEIQARMVRLEYAKNGADLVWLARDDDNKSFSIAFKTPPEDDTGVAHILEHAVLCGSDKYPVKEPFVELLKSSLATFLNAVTWPHFTAYPVASRNERDFQNLVGVYLDAVFHPRCVKEAWVLQQEGWHYEFDTGGRLVRNGVVYSEMKGAMAGVDRIAGRELDRLLFPDNGFGFCSGGDPNHIPELTFEKFKAFYEKHYHPSNARIFLDGKVDLERTLALLDSYLAAYDRGTVASEIPLQRPVQAQRTITYANPEEDGKVVLRDGWVWGTWKDRKEQLALSVIASYLTDSNAAPLKQALLEAKLCEDVSLYADTLQQMSVVLTVRNTATNKVAACRAAYRAALEKVCREGFDAKRLAAKLDQLEFQNRERDTGGFPLGLALCNSALETWMFGGDPAAAFRLEPLFAELRAELKTDYFVRLLRQAVLDNTFHAELTLMPSKTLAAERLAAERAALDKLKDGFSEAQRAATEADAKRLKEIQSTPDKSEDLARLPQLALADIPVQGHRISRTVTDCEGCRRVTPRINTRGIIYFSLAFPVSNLTDDELLDLPFLASVFGDLATENRSVLDLRADMESTFGDFEVAAVSHRTGAYVKVSVSALEKNAAAARELLADILLRTKFTDAAALADLWRQRRDRLEREVQKRGDAFARTYVMQGFGEDKRRAELFNGFAQLRRMQGATTTDFHALAAKVFTRSGMVLCASPNVGAAGLRAFIQSFPEGASLWACSRFVPVFRRVPKGFEIPAEIGFSAVAGKLPENVPFSGAHRVAARIVTLDHLWNAVRVKGGAYGAGMRVDMDGVVSFSSFRDSNPAGAYASFKTSGRALRDFLSAGKSIEKFQVATIGQMEPYRSSRAEMQMAFAEYLQGRTPADYQRLREEVLRTTPAELAAYAAVLEKLADTMPPCVVAGKNILSSCALEDIEPVVAAP